VHHPASLSPPQPWRAAAIVAAAVAALELFVLVLIGVAFGAKYLSDEARKAAVAVPAASAPAEKAKAGPAPAPEANPAEAPAPPTLSRRETSVLVLNGNGTPGAAGTASDQVRRHQYVIAGADNAPRSNFRRSIVMYRPGFEAEARRLAADLKVKRVAPLDGLRIRDLQGAHLALIVGG
jgi:hypothetical protein